MLHLRPPTRAVTAPFPLHLLSPSLRHLNTAVQLESSFLSTSAAEETDPHSPHPAPIPSTSKPVPPPVPPPPLPSRPRPLLSRVEFANKEARRRAPFLVVERTSPSWNQWAQRTAPKTVAPPAPVPSSVLDTIQSIYPTAIRSTTYQTPRSPRYTLPAPVAFASPRADPLPPPPFTPIIASPSAYASSHASKLPRTEPELYHFMWTIRRASSKTQHAHDVFAFHSHDSLRELVSARTYGHVLHLAHATSNLALARDVLADMAERNVVWDERICRGVLAAFIRRGDAMGVQGVLGVMRKARWTEPVALVNWRRDLGSEAKGKGDPWKVWREPPPKPVVEGPKEKEEKGRRRGSQSHGTVKGTENSYRVLGKEDTRFQRQVTRVPRDVARLANHDITALVESLFQDYRGPKALDVAQTWLDVHRPPPTASPPPPLASPVGPVPRSHAHLAVLRAHKTAIESYTRTALVLLNILLKFLTASESQSSTTKDFIAYFVEHHSVSPEHPIVPNEITLWELVAPLVPSPADRAPAALYRRSFMHALRLVNAFGVEHGLAESWGPVRRFRPLAPSQALHQVLEETPKELAACWVRPKIALSLLRIANAEREKFASAPPTPRVAQWWHGLEKSGHEWEKRDLSVEVGRAVWNGLLPPSTLRKEKEKALKKSERGKASVE